MTTPTRIRRHASQDMTLPSEGRRRMLKLMAASAALGGSGCSEPPQEEILPYIHMPERQVAGHPVFYASTLRRNGHGFGVLVETNMGRPTKIEGNPRHPASNGATDVYAQAAILQLWDPDRSRTVLSRAQPATWQGFQESLRQRLPKLKQHGGLRILTGPLTSPTLSARLQAILARYPQARWHSYDASASCEADAIVSSIYAPDSGVQAGVRLHYHLDKARRVLALDADFLRDGPASVRYAGDTLRGRGDQPARKQLYVVESTPGVTGVQADARYALPPQEIEALITDLAGALGLEAETNTLENMPRDSAWRARISWLADSLRAHPGASLIVAGASLSAAAHRRVWLMNEALGNVGKTLTAHAVMAPTATVVQLIKDMRAGKVDTLLILDANPAYDLPAHAGFLDALGHVPCSIHMDAYADETAHAARWHLPRCHDLEDWSDALSTDGVASIIQPAIAPLYGARSPHWLLGQFAAVAPASAYDDVRAYWKAHWATGEALFEQRWRTALRNGVIDGAHAGPLVPVARPRNAGVPASDGDRRNAGGVDTTLLSAVFVNDACVDTGAYANLSWLQELPRPFTRLTWDNAALIGPATARRHGLATGDVVTLETPRKDRLTAPVFVLPGHAEDCLSLPLGYGRRHGGDIAPGVGFDAYALQAMGENGPARRTLLTLVRTGKRHHFARVQHEHDTHERPIIERVAHDAPPMFAEAKPPQASLYPEHDYVQYAWGMSIDLDVCMGCNACVIACQAENNIPVVGKEEVARGRAMHWLRIDYYRDSDSGQDAFQPMACQHCEHAPCELVCPVGATMHDSEGLNVQVYNRCVGTRFCSNNCPYKARRFNFFQYSDGNRNEDRARRNPDVTVRQRGVMEKCTYCVQRISRARIEAQKQGASIQDGDVVTACEAACPTHAIVFGNINDPDSRVSRAKASPRAYRVLEELNTRPRTSYLAQVKPTGNGLQARVLPSSGRAGSENMLVATEASRRSERGDGDG